MSIDRLFANQLNHMGSFQILRYYFFVNFESDPCRQFSSNSTLVDRQNQDDVLPYGFFFL